MTPDDVMTRDIDRMRAMLELMREMAPTPAPAAPADPIAQLKDLVSLAKDLAPAPAPVVEVDEGPAPLPADTPPVMVVVDRVVGVLEKMIDRQAANTAAVGSPVSAEPATHVELPRWLAPFMGYLPQLVQLADAGQSPELVAQQIAANLEPEHIEALEPVLAHDGFPSSIINMIPHLEQRSTWALPFLYALRAATLPVAVDVTEDESETG